MNILNIFQIQMNNSNVQKMIEASHIISFEAYFDI